MDSILTDGIHNEGRRAVGTIGNLDPSDSLFNGIAFSNETLYNVPDSLSPAVPLLLLIGTAPTTLLGSEL